MLLKLKMPGSSPGQESVQVKIIMGEKGIETFCVGELSGKICFGADSIKLDWGDGEIDLPTLWKLALPDQKLPDVDSIDTLITEILGKLYEAVWLCGASIIHQTVMLLGPNVLVSRFLQKVADEQVLEPVKVEPAKNEPNDKNPIDALDPGFIENIFAEGGPIAIKMPNYRYRKEQVEMARQVADCFQTHEFLMVEAGTGVGKSLAYLVPSLMWSRCTGKKVVVSTRTRALQKQLAEKDLPLLKDALSFDFRWEVAYGRDNYICTARLLSKVNQSEDLSLRERMFLASMWLWISRGGSGARMHLFLDAGDAALWSQINATRHSCKSRLCPHYKRCRFYAARRRLIEADLIITNHALLLSDLAAEGGVLPEYEYLVVDEAHNLERTAFERLGTRFDYQDAVRLLNRFSHRTGGIERGYLSGLQARFPNLVNEINQARKRVEVVRSALEKVVVSGQPFVQGTSGSRRLKGESRAVDNIAVACEESASVCDELVRSLEDLARNFEERDEYSEIQELLGQVKELGECLFVISQNIFSESNDVVNWIEWDEGHMRALASAPLEPGQELNRILYQRLKGAVFVSATLTVGNSFEFMKERLGLHLVDPDRIRTWKALSPYDYPRVSRAFLVNDIASPGGEEYLNSIVDCVKAVASTMDCRCLVLFTSKSLLIEAAERLAAEYPEISSRIICQYRDGDYGMLLELMQSSNNGILLGTDTFWEGVDLPGEMLECLIITRLPFRSPEEPFTEANIERLHRERRDSFSQYLLPEAVIRFRQGIGRLIRGEDDWGTVIILDRRLSQSSSGKYYGRVFRESMPMQPLHEVAASLLPESLKEWVHTRK